MKAMIMKYIPAGASVLIVLLFAPGTAFADTVTIPPLKDNTLYESETGAFSNGLGAHVFAGNNANSLARRVLLAYAVAESIPPGSTITSVTLRLNMSRTRLTTNNSVEANIGGPH